VRFCVDIVICTLIGFIVDISLGDMYTYRVLLPVEKGPLKKFLKVNVSRYENADISVGDMYTYRVNKGLISRNNCLSETNYEGQFGNRTL
jgi:hypothetical protein